MSSSFSSSLLKHFKATSGAYSIVTDREATHDASVTIDSGEKDILWHRVNPDHIFRGGGATDNGYPSHHKFILKNPVTTDELPINLSLVHPKKDGNELRLYFSGKFVPASEDIWFIFIRENNQYPFVGFTDQDTWKKIEQNSLILSGVVIDDDDSKYQSDILSPGLIPKSYSTYRYPRDPNLARKVISDSGFICMFDKHHPLFTSLSGTPFLEAHHLIPLSAQSDFKYSLDIAENIVALCPNCHRAIHLAESSIKNHMLNIFYAERYQQLSDKGIDISFHKLLFYYS